MGERDAIAAVSLLILRIPQWLFHAGTQDLFVYSADSSNFEVLIKMCCDYSWEAHAHGNLTEIAMHEKNWFMVRFEMACLIQSTLPWRTLAYNLEGDYPAGFFAYDEIMSAYGDAKLIEADPLMFGAVRDLMRERKTQVLKLGDDVAAEQDRLSVIALGIIQPGLSYMESHFFDVTAPLFDETELFKHVRIGNPDHMRKWVAENPRESLVGMLQPSFKHLISRHLLFQKPNKDYPLHPDVIGLLRELPYYIRACKTQNYTTTTVEPASEDDEYNDASSEDDEDAAAPVPVVAPVKKSLKYGASPLFKANAERLTVFWQEHEKTFPTWTKLAHLIMLLQPSSAASERVFSRLTAILKRPGMDSALIDYIESCLMLAYNGEDGYGWCDDA